MKEKYITIKKASEILGVSPMTLRRWDKKKKLKTKRHPFNDYRVYSKKDLKKISKKLEV